MEKLNFDDIKNFTIFSGIKSLFPSLAKQFLSEILNDKINEYKREQVIKNIIYRLKIKLAKNTIRNIQGIGYILKYGL
ncbi:hypothetical protein AFAEC_1003 [Aliarcobacter faecis]|uniref:hypothetical protein n=1 Tax=Aliarcobacter faecis TaxID=1564138 RepID=UPI00047D8B9B|nr:hypothetical protein [Aliarcobacter faecis]QKF73171.1 hypothetical protein AFAEC_1003 [Aliarcobacter faecis]